MNPPESSIPNLQLQSLAVDFIDTRLHKYHPAFATPPARYDPALGGFVVVPSPPLGGAAAGSAMTQDKVQEAELASPEISSENAGLTPRPLAEPAEALRFWDSIFFSAMHQFQLSTEEPKGRFEAGFSIRDAQDWTTVFDRLEAARKHYFGGANTKATFRRVYRHLADNTAPLFLSLTKLAPQTDCMFVTPVLGSIQIVLEAVKNAAQVRKAIGDSFDDLDFIFSEIELLLQTYPDDNNIKKASTELVVAIFAAVESVIGFLVKSILKRMGGAIFKRDEYEIQVLEALEDVKSRSLRLLRESEGSEKWMISDGMKRILVETGQIRQDVKDGFKAIIDSCLKELDAKIEAKLNAKLEAWNRAALQALIEALSQPRPQGDLLNGRVEYQRISPQELLDWIDVPDVAASDMIHINEKRQPWASSREQARAEQLVQSRQLREWMASAESSQLLVHGDYEVLRQVSGLTLFCASLQQMLAAKSPRFIPLVFFCGMHSNDRTDPNTGGRAIIQSFVCQLLCQVEGLDLSTLADQGIDETLIRMGDVEELCNIFVWLVDRLPQGIVVFCVLDGVVYYERRGFEEDMAFVLMTLLRLSAEGGTAAAVKVLLTSPSRTVTIRQPFPDDLILSMEAMPPLDQEASASRLERQFEELQEGNVEETVM
ncbi:hypothetical protein B0T18DRAFT_395663 [Schizothecium vesticola]|uniref:Fungal STAND N-terminal Goodbye domain-containing protein n=1 Tax=Schizothecium vesticola TaxID=314040 RepID=A0AA40KBD2_9PEZI|nr:hypothetical protein B0T18DRAFT_395663 [Schizothecium vesticola]